MVIKREKSNILKEKIFKKWKKNILYFNMNMIAAFL